MSLRQLSFGTGRQLEYIDYLDALTDFLVVFKNVPSLKQKIQSAYDSVATINQGYFPPSLQTMEVTESDIKQVQAMVLKKYPHNAKLGNQKWNELRVALEQVDYCLRNIRDEFIEDFNMYAYLTPDFLRAVSQYLAGRNTLEIMAGQGYLSAGLRAVDKTARVITTDNQDWQFQPVQAVTPVTEVENLDALAAIQQYGSQVEVVLMSWAPDTSEIDWQVLQLLRQQFPQIEFLVIGEVNGATDSPMFWQQAELTNLATINAVRPQFDLINEKIYRVN